MQKLPYLAFPSPPPPPFALASFSFSKFWAPYYSVLRTQTKVP